MTGALADLALEDMVAGAGFGDLAASPLQRAICRAADGRPLGDLLAPEVVERHFGVTTLPLSRPAIVELVCGVRGGKSWLASCAAVHAALMANLSDLKQYELPRFAIVGPTIDAARATFVVLCGIVQSSRVLRRFMHGEPTADTLVLKRPDGRRVEVVVVAAHRGGLSVRNRWLIGFVLEEVAQFGDAATGAVVNAEELLRAAEARLLPGCQGWLISSPFGPSGLLYDLYREHFGKPGRVLVVHADTRSMNPAFPQATIDALTARDPDAARREYGAEWLDVESAMYASQLVDEAVREHPLELPPPARGACFAAMDAATRGNAWTLAVAWPVWREGRFVVVVGIARQWVGSSRSPLSPSATLRELAVLLAPYRVRRVLCDGWSFDANREIAAQHGLELVLLPHAEQIEAYSKLGTALANGAVELPPSAWLRTDLVSVRKRVTPSGVRVELPRTSDGRHCDGAPATAAAVSPVLTSVFGPRVRRVLGSYQA